MQKLKRTIKEVEFLNAYIKHKGNATKAYLEVFPQVKKNSAAELGSKLLKKIDISMSELLDKIGIDDHTISQKLLEGLNATTTTGKGKDKVIKPNYYIRARYLDMIHRLKAKYPIDETRLRLPGIGDGATSVTLHEIVYGKDGKKKIKEKTETTRSEDRSEEPPF